MIGVDTNVIIRMMMHDDAQQSAAANALFESFTHAEPGWLSQIVLTETFWVLRRTYKIPSDEIVGELARLVSANNLVIEQADTVRAALALAAEGADFADALVAVGARRAGARMTMTFDRRAVASIDSMQLLTGDPAA